MTEEQARKILAEEYEKRGLHDSALVRDGVVSEMDRCALAAMARANGDEWGKRIGIVDGTDERIWLDDPSIERVHVNHRRCTIKEGPTK